MTTAAKVHLWNTCVGAVSVGDGPVARFQYADEFLDSHIELSPLKMPLRAGVFSFPELPVKTFRGLPGLLSDSLPDKFGNAVIDAWLRSQGRDISSLNAVERLCYTGTRGMGALEYEPALLDESAEGERVEVEALAALANDVLNARREARAELRHDTTRFASILKVGSSAGGARAKALIGWNEETGEVRSGQVALPKGFGYWLMKFDGLDGNGDKEGDDVKGYGRIEYAYHLMAKAAGIEMAECRLWRKRHFMTRRFDRLADGGKLHVQTLGALAHLDFNAPRVNSYEQALSVTRRVVPDAQALAQLFRRMVFNVVAWNCDDHVKNISYAMTQDGEWHLAPAYDVCYAYNPAGDWTSAHQMLVNGKARGIADEDMIACAKEANLSAARAKAVIGEVRSAVARWRELADAAGVRPGHARQIAAQLSRLVVSR